MSFLMELEALVISDSRLSSHRRSLTITLAARTMASVRTKRVFVSLSRSMRMVRTETSTN